MDIKNMPRKTDKRARLVDAAKDLIHRQGFNLTTLADIAQEADVPLGNVYYYFKTKEAIGVAIIEQRAIEMVALIAHWSKAADPLARLVAYIQYSLEALDVTARFGCSVGGLCQELGKEGGALADLAAKVLHDILRWTEDQFKALGFADKSASHALNLVSTVQGMFLLTHTFKDPKLAVNQVQYLITWLENLAQRKPEVASAYIETEEEAMV